VAEAVQALRAEPFSRVDLKTIDFSAATGTVRKLDLGPNKDYTFSSDATKSFKPAATPFKFLGLQ
jgi:hypothetical protein